MRKKKSCSVIVPILLECDHLIMHYSTSSLMSTVILLNIFILFFVPFGLFPSIGYVKMV